MIVTCLSAVVSIWVRKVRYAFDRYEWPGVKSVVRRGEGEEERGECVRTRVLDGEKKGERGKKGKGWNVC